MARDIEAGRAYVRVGLKDDLNKQLKGVSKKLKTWGASVSGLGVKLMGLGAAMGAPLVAAISMASDTEEVMNKFNIVFGDASEAVKAWSDQYAASVGRSKKQIAEFMAGSQDLFIPLGFAADSARDLSEQVTQLAVDLASFNNMADEDAIRDLHAALTGSGEVMKKYGVIVSEAAVKQELLNQGMDPKVATDQQKVQARLNIIMRGTTAAQGDAIRSAGAFANQMKALKGSLHDTASEIGAALLPVVTPLVQHAAMAVRVMSQWAVTNTEAIQSFARTAAAVIGLGAALVGVGVAIKGIGLALALLTSPVALVVGAVVGAGAALAHFTDTGRWATDELKGDFGNAAESVQSALDGIADAMASGNLGLAMQIGMTGVKAAFTEAVRTMFATWVEFQKSLVTIAQQVATNLQHLWGGFQSWNQSVGFRAAVQQLDQRRSDSSMSDDEYNRQLADLQESYASGLQDLHQDWQSMLDAIEGSFEGTIDALDRRRGEFEDGAAALRAELIRLREEAGYAAEMAERERAARPKPGEVGVGGAGVAGGSSGTFSAIAAQIMFAGESTDKKIEENTRNAARSLRRLERWTIEGAASPTFS
jgi:phage host-nuclease inhibitor protein Gam